MSNGHGDTKSLNTVKYATNIMLIIF